MLFLGVILIVGIAGLTYVALYVGNDDGGDQNQGTVSTTNDGSKTITNTSAGGTGEDDHPTTITPPPHPGAGQSAPPHQSTVMTVHGNNGTCPCSHYCQTDWGGQMRKAGWKGAVCMSSQFGSCNTLAGKATTCTCQRADDLPFASAGKKGCGDWLYFKSYGNNGSVNCAKYCTGWQTTQRGLSDGKCTNIKGCLAKTNPCDCMARAKDRSAQLKSSALPTNLKWVSGNNGTCTCTNYCQLDWSGELKQLGWKGALCAGADKGQSCSSTYHGSTKCLCKRADQYPFGVKQGSCMDPFLFESAGNNGSVSCGTYCKGWNTTARGLKDGKCTGGGCNKKGHNPCWCLATS